MILPEIASLSRCAMFLDFDGTLADIAPEPSRVTVDPATVTALGALREHLGGALAIVSGREIGDLDRLLAPHVFPAAGVHGAVRRDASGQMRADGLTPAIVSTILAECVAMLGREPGILIERKTASVAIHYRARPELRSSCERTAARLAASTSGLRPQPGKMVIELVASEIDKGTAIRAFLTEQPFAGRRPVFAGDDATDEPGFAVVNDFHGVSIKIGDGDTIACERMNDGRALQAWLLALSQRPRDRDAS